MWSIVSSEGERPACGQKMRFSTRALSGRQSKTSVKHVHTFALPYLRRHSS